MVKVLKWRVVYGYSPTDYVSIEEDKLEEAKYAWITKSIFSASDRMISGSEIKRIEPDFRYYTGWSEGYEPKGGDDFAEMRRYMPTLELEERNRVADARVKYVIQNNNPQLLSNLEKLDTLLPESDRPVVKISSTGGVDTSALVEKFKL